MTAALIPPVQPLQPHVMSLINYSGETGTPGHLTLPYYKISLQPRACRARLPVGSSVHHDAEYQGLLVHIRSLKGLSENWDRYGAEAVSGKVVSHTLSIISSINDPQFHGLPLPEISPETNGTISMSWESNKGEAYLEVGQTRCAGYIQCITSQNPSLIGFLLSEDRTPIYKMFEDILQQLYSPNSAVSPFAFEIFAE